MAVFVVDKHHQPLMPCSEKRARLLLTRGRARIHSIYPFVIRITDRKAEESTLQPLRCKIDPGSVTTGIALVRENVEEQIVVSLIELKHRGSTISQSLKARAARRKRKRFNLRYRSPRFNNRCRHSGWIPPSLYHRVETVTNFVQRLRKWVPLAGITCETVRFDTQKLLDPEIQGTEYQRGTLLGCEIREYLLEKWGRKCIYCNAKNIPLQIDHIIPRSLGGSDRVDNLTLACKSCNQKKGNLPLEDFAPKQAEHILKKPSFRDAAAVNSTRHALWDKLTNFPFPCESSTGGQTKYNRERLGIPKTHSLDAACTGTMDYLQNWQMPIQQVSCMGRGSYQRTRSDRFGFPRGILMRKKKVQGFQTGDHIVAKVAKGKKKGHYAGRVAVRASGSFNIQTGQGVIQGISWKDCKLVQRANGYHYSRLVNNWESKEFNALNQKGSGASSQPLKGWVSAPSKG
jgi:5-methylcytosine-specific restriction endonuclease McrA